MYIKWITVPSCADEVGSEEESAVDLHGFDSEERRYLQRDEASHEDSHDRYSKHLIVIAKNCVSRLGKFKKNKQEFMIKLKAHIINEMKLLYPAALSFVAGSMDLGTGTSAIDSRRKKDPIFLLIND
jgi:hypothetical protein